MKNFFAIFRWAILALIFLIMYILGIVLFPIHYGFRKLIRKHKIVPFWWFLDTSEADYISNTYGDTTWRETHVKNFASAGWIKRIWIGFRWVAIRNSHWNFKLLVAPKTGPYEDKDIKVNRTIPETNGLVFCNYDIIGKQYAFFTVDGKRYFRYSFTKNTWFFGKKVWNLQFGTSEVRYIYKSKFKTRK